jgi:hypothetical protein
MTWAQFYLNVAEAPVGRKSGRYRIAPDPARRSDANRHRKPLMQK